MHTNTKWSADMLYMTVENYYKKISEMKLAEILFYTFPLSFIVGNFALSLHLILFIVSLTEFTSCFVVSNFPSKSTNFKVTETMVPVNPKPPIVRSNIS